MKIRIIFAVAVLALGLLANSQKPVHVIGTKIEIVPPAGFSKAERFTGFISEETGASIMIVELPVDYSKISSGFTKEGFASKGMKLLNQEKASFGEFKGNLFLLSQESNGITYHKWTGAFGDEKTSYIINGAFPSELQETLSETMKQSVLSARITTKQGGLGSALKFKVSSVGDMKISSEFANSLILSKGGKFPSKKPDDPRMVIAPSISYKMAIKDRKAFALSSFNRRPIFKDTKAQQTSSVRINGLPGFETVGTGIRTSSGKKYFLYQVVVFEKYDYYVMIGTVNVGLKSNYLPIFRKIARSFRRIPVKS